MKKTITYNLTAAIALNETEISKYPIPEVNEIDVNLTQLQRNFKILRDLLKPEVKFMAVLKGDAYGHGLVPIAMELEKCKCDAFGVVRLIEAFTLRKSGIEIPIILLAPIIPSQCSWIVINEIIPMVDNEEIVKAIETSAREENKVVNVHVKVNTGLNRYGVDPKDVVNFIRVINKNYNHIRVQGIYTHFQDAEYNSEFTKKQISCFDNVLKELEKEDLLPRLVHAAGSSGVLTYPQSHYNMVRCGIVLYGLEHQIGEKVIPKGVEPLVTLKARIIKINKIKPGEYAGYGSKFKAEKEVRVAVVGIGYGDGVSRGWKEVLINGQRVPAIAYFMDGIMVDITTIKEPVKEFDEAVIIGTQGNETITWEEACKSIGTYADEQIQRITERVPKHYFYE